MFFPLKKCSKKIGYAPYEEMKNMIWEIFSQICHHTTKRN
jgi:hypothetical protein